MYNDPLPKPTHLSPERVKYFRQDNGWSQELLAKASGLSLRTIQRAEKDGNSSTESKLALAAALNKSVQELLTVSSTPDVHWKRKNIMQNLVALVIVCGAILMVFMLGGRLAIFSDFYGGLFLFLFTYSATVIAFGSQGLYKSVIGLRYLFVNDIAQTPASEFLAIILKKQISFIYGGASIALLIGSVSIFSSAEALASTTVFYNAFAINILIILYAAIFAEGLLRPLSTKLEKRLTTIK